MAETAKGGEGMTPHDSFVLSMVSLALSLVALGIVVASWAFR